MNLDKYFPQIENVEGVWQIKNETIISYPDQGYGSCFEVENDSFWFSNRNQLIKTVTTAFPFEGLFFDIGGGNGFVTQLFEENGVLVEPGVSAIKNAQKRGIRHIVCAAIEEENTIDNSLENVGIFDVLEHIPDDIEFLKLLNRKMKTNGYLYITVPAYRFLWSSIDPASGHYRRYTQKEIKTKLKTAGFSLLFSSGFFRLLIPIIFCFRTIPSFFGAKYNETTAKKQLKPKKSLFEQLFHFFAKNECNKIARLKSFCLGASLIVVAKKTELKSF